MFPELFKIPYLDFPVNTYGLLLAISFLVGMYVMAKQAERDGLNVNRVYDLGLWVLGSALIGSKLLMVITEWENYRDNLKGLFSLDFLRSAGVFYGGFLGALIASVIVMRIYKLEWWRTADAFAPGIIIGQAIGRLGCFSAGCCWATTTHFVQPLTTAPGFQLYRTSLITAGGFIPRGANDNATSRSLPPMRAMPSCTRCARDGPRATRRSRRPA